MTQSPPSQALLDSCEELLPERFSEFDRSEIDFTDLFKQMDGFSEAVPET